jgi:pimeloyl-ACP methyl ester carboxylesterase
LFNVQKAVSHNGKRITYNVTGDGTPLMLIHGFGFDAAIWKAISPMLSDVKLIIPDLPGVRNSETLANDPTIDAMAFAMAGIIEAEVNGPCNVIGHSMGGYVTLALVEQHPQLVNAFGLFHSHPFADDEPRRAKREKDVQFIQSHGSALYIKVLLPGLFGQAFKNQNADVIDDLVERYSDLSPEGLVYALRAMKERPDRSHIVSSSTKPFLFVAGVEDSVVSMEMVNRIYKMPQYTYGLFIRQAAHMGMIEFPLACANHIRGWLSAIR